MFTPGLVSNYKSGCTGVLITCNKYYRVPVLENHISGSFQTINTLTMIFKLQSVCMTCVLNVPTYLLNVYLLIVMYNECGGYLE